MTNSLDIKTPQTEEERLALVERWNFDALSSDPLFDEIAERAAELCDTPVAIVAFITRDEQCNLGMFGFDLRTFDRDLSFCAHVVQHKSVLIVEDTHQDSRFVDSDLVTGAPHIRFYAGIPLLIDNRVAVGSLSVIDTHPRRLSAQERAGLMGLVYQIELRLNVFVAQTEGAAFPFDKTVDTPGSRAYEKRLSHKTYLGTHLLTKMRQHIGFLSADLKLLSSGGESSDAVQIERLHEEIGWALEMIDRLAEGAQSVLCDPEGKLASNTTISLGEIVQSARRSLSHQLRSHSGQFIVSHRTVEDLVFGHPVLLNDFATQVFEMILHTVAPESDVEVIIDSDGDDVIFEVLSEGDMPPEAVRQRLFEMYPSLDTDTDVDLEQGFEWEHSLTLCAMIVEAHRGSIDLSEVGPNRRSLRVTFPAASAVEADEFSRR